MKSFSSLRFIHGPDYVVKPYLFIYLPQNLWVLQSYALKNIYRDRFCSFFALFLVRLVYQVWKQISQVNLFLNYPPWSIGQYIPYYYNFAGYFIWIFVCCCFSQNKFSYLQLPHDMNREENLNKENFTLASINVLLANEVFCRLNNNRDPEERCKLIGLTFFPT